MLIRRSRKSHMRSPRSVVITPIGIPSRSLKLAIEFLAFVMTGLLTGHDRHIACRRFQRLAVLQRFAKADVDRNLLVMRGTCITLR
jgi:hypothetical protein